MNPLNPNIAQIKQQANAAKKFDERVALLVTLLNDLVSESMPGDPLKLDFVETKALRTQDREVAAVLDAEVRATLIRKFRDAGWIVHYSVTEAVAKRTHTIELEFQPATVEEVNGPDEPDGDLD